MTRCYWKVEALVGDRKRRMFLEGDWSIRLGRRCLVGKVVDANGEAIEKRIPGGLSVEIVWLDETDVIGKCIEMEVSNKYARLVPRKGEITNCD